MDRTASDLLQNITSLTYDAVNSSGSPDNTLIQNLLRSAANSDHQSVGDVAVPDELIAAAAALMNDESLVDEIKDVANSVADPDRSIDAMTDAVSKQIGAANMVGNANSQDLTPGSTGDFTKDPYVAQNVAPASCAPPPKSIEEILQSISGYQSELEEIEAPISKKSDALPVEVVTEESESTTTAQPAVVERVEVEIVEATAEPSVETAQTPGQAEAQVVDKSQTDSHAHFESESPFEPVRDIEPSAKVSSPIEVDVRNFNAATSGDQALPAPDPIRNGFEVDQEFFDYQTTESLTGIPPEMVSAGATIASDEPTAVTSEIQPADAQSQPADVQSQPADVQSQPAAIQSQPADVQSPENLFLANTGDVIYIDGKEGFGHIDLACFDVSDATFQSNQILIACDDGTEFQIDYRNVTHAVFANDVQIELAANDPGFNSYKFDDDDAGSDS